MDELSNFIGEIMLFLNEDDMVELSDKAGVRFPLEDYGWSDLCYICCWMGFKRKLPDSLHNRMVLGESNVWVRLYMGRQGHTLMSSCVLEKTGINIFDLAG